MNTHRLCQTHGEVYRHLQVHAVPVGVKEDAQLLHSAQGKHRDEHFASTFHTIMHLLQEITLPVSEK